MPGWVNISISSLLRTMATSNTIVKDAIMCGELVPQDIVMQVLEQQIILNRDTDGAIIDGYPRDLSQVEEFQNKVRCSLQANSLITTLCSSFNFV